MEENTCMDKNVLLLPHFHISFSPEKGNNDPSA
jgi:hypothetical protein